MTNSVLSLSGGENSNSEVLYTLDIFFTLVGLKPVALNQACQNQTDVRAAQ